MLNPQRLLHTTPVVANARQHPSDRMSQEKRKKKKRNNSGKKNREAPLSSPSASRAQPSDGKKVVVDRGPVVPSLPQTLSVPHNSRIIERGRPPILYRRSPPSRCMFLELPREIRDIIYDLVYEGAFVEVSPLSCSRISARNKIQASASTGNCVAIGDARAHRRAMEVEYPSNNKAARHGHLLHLPVTTFSIKRRVSGACTASERRKYGTSNSAEVKHTALLFTSKLISREFGYVVYARTLFAFSSCAGVMRLLRDHQEHKADHRSDCSALGQPPIATYHRSVIKHLCLHFPSYGEPCNPADVVWRARYYNAWTSTIRHLSSVLSNLDRLTIAVDIPHDRPYSLHLGALWVAPLLEVSKFKRIKSLSVTLFSPAAREVSAETLSAFAEVIQRKLLGWDTPSALEAIVESSRRSRMRGRLLVEQWEKLHRWNGLEWRSIT